MKNDSLARRWLRGMLDRLRENTVGADDDLVNMMGKLDRGEIRWIGRIPFNITGKKIAGKKKDR